MKTIYLFLIFTLLHLPSIAQRKMKIENDPEFKGISIVPDFRQPVDSFSQLGGPYHQLYGADAYINELHLHFLDLVDENKEFEKLAFKRVFAMFEVTAKGEMLELRFYVIDSTLMRSAKEDLPIYLSLYEKLMQYEFSAEAKKAVYASPSAVNCSASCQMLLGVDEEHTARIRKRVKYVKTRIRHEIEMEKKYGKDWEQKSIEEEKKRESSSPQ